MDGLLNTSVLNALGPLGVAAIALCGVYFLWQRQTEQFSTMVNNLKTAVTTFEAAIGVSNTNIEKNRTDNIAAVGALAAQNSAFQLQIVDTRVTRTEMNEAIGRVTENMRDMLNPMSADLTAIKMHMLKGPAK